MQEQLRRLRYLIFHSMSKLRQAARTRAATFCPLRTALCRTSTFQNSYFVRIVKLWNYVCKSAPPNCYDTLSNFKTYLHKTYLHLTATTYTPDEPSSHSLIATNWHLPLLHVSLPTSPLFSSTVLITFRFSFLFHIFCLFCNQLVVSTLHGTWSRLSASLLLAPVVWCCP